jgi:hypothetical protein
MLGGVQAFFGPLKDSFTGECAEETIICDVFTFIFFGKGQKHSLPCQF